jgi:hypothetical protein
VNGAVDPLDLRDSLETASDFAIDLGGIVHLSEWTKIERGDPTFGIVLQNVTDLDFKAVGEIPMQVNVGAAIHPEFGSVKSVIALDIKDIGQSIGTDDDFGKRTHFGVELKFPKVLSVRVGASQGYFSGGVTLDFWILRLDVATYAEELGASFRQRDDRRTLAQLSLGF